MTTIKEDYVSFEVAKLLKEKGFDEATNRYYNAQYDQIRTVSDTFMWHWNDEEFMKRVLMEGAVAIPTHQMAMKWLRKEHSILITIIPQEIKVGIDVLCYGIYRITEDLYQPLYNGKVDNLVDSYEEAVEAAIKYCLENLF